MSGRTLRTASFAVAFAVLPLTPAFIGLTGATVPGVAIVPRSGALALFGLAIVLVAGWSAMLLAARPRPLPTLIPLAALPAAAIAAALLGFDPRAGAVFVAILGFGVVWQGAIVRFVDERGAVRAVLASFIVSGALACLVAIALVVTKTPADVYTIGHGRATGTFVLPGELAGYLIVYIPVALATARAAIGLRAIAAAGALVACAAFVLTFSRAGWIGLGGALAACILLRGRGRGARYATAIVAAAVLAVVLVFNSHHDPSENFTRLSIWQAALRTIEAFPFSGAGPFEFARTYPLMRLPGGEAVALHAHSIALTIAAETGLLGCAAVAWGWWRFGTELAARLHERSPLRGVALAIAAGLIGTWVQGIVDTVSIVIFGMWLPFMGLALACAGTRPAEHASQHAGRAPLPRIARATAWRGVAPRALSAAVACAVAAGFAVIQAASDGIEGWAAAPYALPAHIPAAFGERVYGAIERIAPLLPVERMLTEDALRRGDARAAAAHAERLPSGIERDDLLARVAASEHRDADAIASYIAAGDDRALAPFVTRLTAAGRLRDAYALELRIRDRLAADETRPNALADSWWMLGSLAARSGRLGEAQRDVLRAVALAPLNTTYLVDAARLALERGDARSAQALARRALDIDPADARAAALLRRIAGAPPR